MLGLNSEEFKFERCAWGQGKRQREKVQKFAYLNYVIRDVI